MSSWRGQSKQPACCATSDLARPCNAALAGGPRSAGSLSDINRSQESRVASSTTAGLPMQRQSFAACCSLPQPLGTMTWLQLPLVHGAMLLHCCALCSGNSKHPDPLGSPKASGRRLLVMVLDILCSSTLSLRLLHGKLPILTCPASCPQSGPPAFCRCSHARAAMPTPVHSRLVFLDVPSQQAGSSPAHT